jgi:outer membrane PBP1 activator LpoA protein
LLAISLTHCGNNVKPATTGAATKNEPRDSKTTALSPKDLVALAQQKNSPERELLMLQAASIYLDQSKLDKARNLVNEIDSTQLSDPILAKYSEVAGSLNLKDGQVDSARRILTNRRLERQFNALEPQQEAALRELRAQAFERSGQSHDSITERINLSTLLTNKDAVAANQDALWQTLMTLPLSELQENAAKGAGGITQGWFSLAALSKNNTLDIESQQAALNKWLIQWSSHPAASNLPKDLRMLQTMISRQPHKIALILPLQGRLTEAGEAVRDGFFAAYYQSIANHRQAPSVREYDTSKGATAAYQQAVSDGADLIIGPLDKEDVNRISHMGTLPVPLLSLNYPDQQPAQPIANFYQFGLAVEDEARQVARQGIQDGHTRALVVISTQESSERSAAAFIDEWQKLGGTIIGKSLFTDLDHFSETFREQMSINESHARMVLLQQQLATKFEFFPRRRMDVDMVFMAVTPAQGRQIKPTMIFHYAGSIPTYSTSNIYSGDVDTLNNEDLNGVFFNTLPWIFDTDNPEKQAIAQNTKSAAVYGRLHALGADAFHLYARLPQLKQAPQMRIYGATGSLHLLADGRIEREQVWARFNNGLAEPIPTTIDHDETENGGE